MKRIKKTLPGHFSDSYFTKFKQSSSIKTFLLQIIDRKEPTFSQLKRHFPKGSTLLDYGCGNGIFLRHADSHFQATGIDFSAQAIALAKKVTPRSKLIHGNEKSLRTIKTSSLDIITCFDVLEHVPDPTLLLKEFHRILKPTGWLIISVPITDSIALTWKQDKWWAMEDKSHFWLWPTIAWKLLLNRHGFMTHRINSIGLLNSPVPAYSISGFHYLLHLVTQALAIVGIPLPLALNDVIHLVAIKNPHSH
jgi:ubiquinone/menaquinone biosynthesis C-methylase UbiE